jgi:hypothetical protein
MTFREKLVPVTLGALSALALALALALAVAVALALAGCAAPFAAARLTEPATASTGTVRVQVQRILLTEEDRSEGFGEDSTLVVEVTVSNRGPQPYRVDPAAFVCLMEIDPGRPSETRALLPKGGAEGTFPGEAPTDGSLRAPLVVPPGQTRSWWVLFGGYDFPDSDLPRRVTLTLPPGADGRSLEVTLADPARGRLRWSIAPAEGGWGYGVQNVALFGAHLKATGVSAVISRLARVGRLLWEGGLTSMLLVQTEGALVSSTSSFLATGLGIRLTVPLLMWGSLREPRHLGVYGGATGLFLTEIQTPQSGDSMAAPNIYGAVAAEAGLALDIGARRLAGTPFPLSPSGHPLPRWSIRVGYNQWWIADGTSAGYTTSLRLAW